MDEIDINSPLGLGDGIAFRHRMMLLDKAAVDKARYVRYALIAHDQAVGVTAGRVDPNATPFVPGQAGWPEIPFEALVSKNDAGFEFVEPDQNGPRRLNEVDDNYPVIPTPEDHHLTQLQRQMALPQGVIDIGPGENGSTEIFTLGPKDTWPAGVITPPIDGHKYLKFAWAGFGYKYQKVS